MCGINGLWALDKSISDNDLGIYIHKMNDTIVHRGPDSEGSFVSNGFSFGMRRLSIIGLTSGSQPIFNEDKTLGIVFNGEIYNFKILKEELLRKGHLFRSSTDTEVILHSFEEYGCDCLTKIKGMFAFAIFDFVKKECFIARDRAGEKPLYFTKQEHLFCFSSELKSMLSISLFEKKINQKALTQYFLLSYIPAPLSIFENIQKLPAGCYAIIDCQGNVKIKTYWDNVYNSQEMITDFSICQKKLRTTLFDAVEQCLVSDVPVGTFLSGGIDSTIITVITSQIKKQPFDAFTIGYHNKAYDETDRAKLTVEKFPIINHHIFYLEYRDVLGYLDTILENIDEPFSDSSYIPSYVVSRFAKQYVKTVLTGDAGDELFAGYNKYLIGYYSSFYRNIPSILRFLFEKIIFSMPDNNSFIRKSKKVIVNFRKDIDIQRIHMACLSLLPNDIGKLMISPYIDSLDFMKQEYDRWKNETDEVGQTLYLDFKTVLEGDMLAKVDRASMLASLETRTPMLYPDVVELAAKIPSHYKINKKNRKFILKETFRDLIPTQLLNASKKGFAVPIAEWFRNELKEDLLQTLNEETIVSQRIFHYDFVKTLIREHLEYKSNHTGVLWGLYVFEKWYKKNFANV